MNRYITKQNILRRFCATDVKAKRVLGLAEKPNPDAIQTDYVGPPDKKSNLRPYVRHIPEYETNLEKYVREKRLEVENWNEDFWTKHNKRFFEEKEEFVRNYQLNENDEKAANKMSIFYKHFLDKNRKMHMLYNVSWYLKNADLLILALQVHIQKLYYKIKKRSTSN